MRFAELQRLSSREPAAEMRRLAMQKGFVMNAVGSRFALAAAVAAMVLAGCSSPSNTPSSIVAEGIIYSVEYQLEGGRTGGFTRANNAKAVPGGNGSWNVDAYGKLTRDFLLITRPKHSDLGPEVIPAHRLINIQFGDGGIKQVKENQSAPPD
jgi:hypothetical protein